MSTSETSSMGSKDLQIQNTTFIVIDFEWNQPISWIKTSIDPKTLPGEIIEIGAVKVTFKDGEWTLSKPFHRLIRPIRYTVLNKSVARVINKVSSDLKSGDRFDRAYMDFMTWCGTNFVICGWGNSDLGILKSNLRLHNQNSDIGHPFLDIQPLFSRLAEDSSRQRSVEYAVDFFGIAKRQVFHEAHRDAHYTAQILRQLLLLAPEKTDDELVLNIENTLEIVEKFIYNPDLNVKINFNTDLFFTWETCFSNARKLSLACPACGATLIEELAWFRVKKSAFSLWRCERHQFIRGRMRMKKNPVGKIYATVDIHLIIPSEIRKIQEKHMEYLEFGTEGKPKDIIEKPSDPELS